MKLARMLAGFSAGDWRALCVCAAGLMAVGAAMGQTLTQTVDLRPGWNAVHIEVAPSNATPAAVFTNREIVGVWTWSERVAATDFIENPAESGWNRSKWLAFFPWWSTNAFLSTMRSVVPQTAHLVQVRGTNGVVLEVTGRPVYRVLEWAPDAYNLRGFAVESKKFESFAKETNLVGQVAIPGVTFGQYFAAAPAHYDAATRTLGKVYRLNAAGVWETVTATNEMQRGEAYWVYSEGASDFAAPMEIETTGREGLKFTRTEDSLSITIRNRSGSAATVVIGFLGEDPPPLVYQDLTTMQEVDGHRQMGVLSQMEVGAGLSRELRLRLTPAAMSADTYENVFTVGDNGTCVWHVPLRASR